MKKKIGAFGAGQFSLGTLAGGRPGTTIFQNPGGGWGVSHTRTGPGRPPVPPTPLPCDIHVAGCGEQLPAWGLRDDRIPGTDRAVRGGCHGQKLHSGFPPRGRGMPTAVRLPAVVRMPACHSRRFKGERPIGAATG